MLLGHNDKYIADRAMRVTVAFNRFGVGLIERMPRWKEVNSIILIMRVIYVQFK